MQLIRSLSTFIVVLCVARATLADPPAHSSSTPQQREGICVLVPTENSHVTGTISLLQEGESLHIAGEVRHLKPGAHTLGIHQFGDIRAPDGTTVGRIFKGTSAVQATSASTQHPLGNLGPIEANAEGIALVDIMAHGLTSNALIGRSIGVGARRDETKSQPSGEARPLVAVGVIGFRQRLISSQ